MLAVLHCDKQTVTLEGLFENISDWVAERLFAEAKPEKQKKVNLCMRSNSYFFPGLFFFFSKVQQQAISQKQTGTHNEVDGYSDAHWTHHGQQKAENHKKVVVCRECHTNPESKLTEAGEHQNPDSTNSGGKEQTWRRKNTEAGKDGMQRKREELHVHVQVNHHEWQLC